MTNGSRHQTRVALRPTHQDVRRKVESDLDQELEGTFPASDPLKITRRPPESGGSVSGNGEAKTKHRR
jgi:hypothetical protein